MKHLRLWPVAVAVGLLLTACGGGGDGDQSQRVSYGKLVSFGDSLSDVGSYATTGVKTYYDGGKFTINATSDSRIWLERLADQAGLAAPCAYQTGLNSTGTKAVFAQAVATHADCHVYAQGGSRVTNPYGPGNVVLDTLAGETSSMGATTVPVVTQVANHLTKAGGTFSSTDLVTVLAGANDLFVHLTQVSAGNETTTAAVTAMATAATELAALVTDQMIAKGAQRVVVVNLPDVGNTPKMKAAGSSAMALASTMVSTFNSTLQAALSGKSEVLFVDAYTVNHDQITNPAQYGLTNVTTPACINDGLTSSLLCATDSAAGTTLDSTLDYGSYLFADDVHPTPYGHKLLAQLVAIRMAQRGWL